MANQNQDFHFAVVLFVLHWKAGQMDAQMHWLITDLMAVAFG